METRCDDGDVGMGLRGIGQDGTERLWSRDTIQSNGEGWDDRTGDTD
jgi:hypothetical protein